MTSDFSDIEGLLGMPDASVSNVISLPDDNLFSQQTFSLSDNQFGLTDSTEDVTKSIERMIETKLLTKIEEVLLRHVRSENEELRRLISANTTKADHIIQLFNDRFNPVVPDVQPVVSTPNGRNGMCGGGDGFELGMDKDLFSKVDSVFSEAGSSGGFFGNKKEFIEEKLDAVEKKLDSIYEHIHVSNKKSCLLYTSPSPRDATLSRMPSSA